MTVLALLILTVLALLILAAVAFIYSLAYVLATGFVDGEHEERSARLGKDSYENKFVGPWAWAYNVAYTYCLWRQSPVQVARSDARTARNKARLEERRKTYNQKEN